ncbi:MAG: hypothetical protein H6838_18115 [Planctomycetes bacterium]|nr:hypothetical protein [Planctomycetota bacterium]MCB9887412.1 hypothetical protein [Planctomycetota bacterium]
MKSSLLLCVLATAATAVAQTTVNTIALTPIAALTRSSAGDTFDGIAANTAIGSSPTNVFLGQSQSQAGYQSATTIIYPTMPYQGGIGVNFFERAYARGTTSAEAGSSASATAAGATFGPHAILCTFHASPGTVGHIILNFRASTAPNGATSFALDVDNDNVVDASGTATTNVSLPYTFGPSGSVDVRVDNECYAVGNGSSSTQYSWTEIWVAFRPDLTATCTIQNYGTGCGPVAAGNELVIGNQRVLTMLVTGCYPNAPVIAVTGTQQLNLQLPGGCALLSSGEAITLLTADGAGLASKSWTIPVTALGTAFHQFLPVTLQGNSLVFSASNGVRIDCTP